MTLNLYYVKDVNIHPRTHTYTTSGKHKSLGSGGRNFSRGSFGTGGDGPNTGQSGKSETGNAGRNAGRMCRKLERKMLDMSGDIFYKFL